MGCVLNNSFRDTFERREITQKTFYLSYKNPKIRLLNAGLNKWEICRSIYSMNLAFNVISSFSFQIVHSLLHFTTFDTHCEF